MATIHVDVISAEYEIFSGNAKFVTPPDEVDELGVLPGYMPLITRIEPDAVRIEKGDDGEEFVLVVGDILEVQPKKMTVLADIVICGHDLDEVKTNGTRRTVEEALQNQSSDLDLTRAQDRLVMAAAQLAAIAHLRHKR